MAFNFLSSYSRNLAEIELSLSFSLALEFSKYPFIGTFSVISVSFLEDGSGKVVPVLH
jgi:hypothetical protein